jgi:hypothetical protein
MIWRSPRLRQKKQIKNGACLFKNLARGLLALPGEPKLQVDVYQHKDRTVCAALVY